MSEEEKSFAVKDHRRFTEEGAPRKDSEEAGAGTPKPGESEQSKAETKARTESKKPSGKTGGEADRSAPLPEITFSTFVFSLSTSAMMHLGEISDPNTNRPNADLSLAKQTIDILGMLKEKTRGNLLEDEKNLLDNLLYDLRLKYVRKTRA